MKPLGNTGLVGRFRPLHNGGALLLEHICEKSESVIIGIGSTNKYNVRNPFTADETKDMVKLFLGSTFNNYSIINVPDFPNDPSKGECEDWIKYVVDHYGKLDNFVTGNPYVKRLLQDHYNIVHPSEIIPEKEYVDICATQVRLAMAKGEGYMHHVPKTVMMYLEENKIVERFRDEFGLETLALDEKPDENIKEERRRIIGGENEQR